MKKTEKNKKFISIMLSALVLMVFLTGSYQLKEQTGSVYQTLKDNISYPSVAEVNVNRTLAGERSEPVDEQEESGDDYRDIVFLISRAKVFNYTPGMGLIIFMGLCAVCIRTKTKTANKYKDILEGKLRYYREWSVHFLSPIQKSILNRADVYDINPIEEYSGEKNPRFSFSMRSAGFFY